MYPFKYFREQFFKTRAENLKLRTLEIFDHLESRNHPQGSTRVNSREEDEMANLSLNHGRRVCCAIAEIPRDAIGAK